MGDTRIKQNALGNGCFPGVNMGDNADITGSLEGIFAGHNLWMPPAKQKECYEKNKNSWRSKPGKTVGGKGNSCCRRKIFLYHLQQRTWTTTHARSRINATPNMSENRIGNTKKPDTQKKVRSG